MKLTTNENLVKRRATIGRWAASLGIGVLFAGVLASFVRRDWWVPWVSWATLIIGFVTSSYGSTELAKWARVRRADKILGAVLKGLDDRFHLFNYILPAEHILLTPKGILVIRAKLHRGEIINDGDRWKQRSSLGRWFREGFGLGSLGHPGKEAQWEAKKVQEFLGRSLPGQEVPVEAVVAFLHDEAQLQVEDPALPVLTAKEVAPFVREWIKGKPLPRSLQREVEKALEGEFARAQKRAAGPLWARIIRSFLGKR